MWLFAHCRPQLIQYAAGRQEGCPSFFVRGGTQMFSKIITLVALARLPVVLELLAVLPVPHEPVVHFCGLGDLWLQIFVINPSAVVLSVWMSVGGCLWPISSNKCRASIAWLELMYRVPISASAADVITFLII